MDHEIAIEYNTHMLFVAVSNGKAVAFVHDNARNMNAAFSKA